MSRNIVLAGAFFRALARRRWPGGRRALERWQSKRIASLIAHAAATTALYAPFASAELSDLPIVDKGMLLDAFARFNGRSLDAATAVAIIEGRMPAMAGFEVGRSTGTSGQRGLYVISEAERFAWLGTILAKAIPDVVTGRHRVAVILPGASPLYQAANQSRLLRLSHLDPTRGPSALVASLEALAPTVLVAAPKTLRWLAESKVAVKPSRLFAAAEGLDPPDRAIIGRWFGVPVGQIYMATEGLFGVTCRHGTLHLAEDVAHFELVPTGEDPTLVTPLVTDFTRRTQILARYRLDDLLRLHAGCACGSSLRAVTVVGRREDLFSMRAASRAAAIDLSPDRMRDAVLAADPAIDDYRIHRDSADTVRLTLSDTVPGARAETARAALEEFCRAAGADARVVLTRQPLVAPFDHKLRRVRAVPAPE